MFKIYTLLFSVLIFAHTVTNAQNFSIEWDQRFGGNMDDIVSVVLSSGDGGYLIAGTSFSGLSFDKSEPNHDSTLVTSDFWVVRTDNNGTKLWDKRFGGTRGETLHSAIRTEDGGFLLFGQSYSDNDGDKSHPNHDTTLLTNDIWIVKINDQGQKQWDNRYGGLSSEIPGEVLQTADGGYLICGSTIADSGGDVSESGVGGWDYWILRTDASGNKVWDQRIGGTQDDFANSVDSIQGGGYVIGGHSTSSIGGDKTQGNQGSSDYWIVHIDELGNLLQDINFGGNNNDWLFDLAVIPGKGFLLGGQSFSEATGDKSEPNNDPTPSGSDRWLVLSDFIGNKIWDHVYGGNQQEDLKNIALLSDGGFLITGESYSSPSGDKSEPNLGLEQTWLMKTDSAGLLLWEKTLFTYGHDEKGYSLADNDSCFITINYTRADTGGYKSQMSRGEGDFWMIKTCVDSFTSLYETSDSHELFSVWPNPSYGDFQLIFHKPGSQNVLLEIYDVSGNIIYRNEKRIQSSAMQTIVLPDISSGIYLLKVSTDQTAAFRKLVIIN